MKLEEIRKLCDALPDESWDTDLWPPPLENLNRLWFTQIAAKLTLVCDDPKDPRISFIRASRDLVPKLCDRVEQLLEERVKLLAVAEAAKAIDPPRAWPLYDALKDLEGES